MAITDKIVTKERLQYFKGKLDANGYKNVIEKIKVNGTSQSVNTTDKSVNLFLPTWDFDHGATSYSKTVALLLRTEDGQSTRKGMALSIDNDSDPQKVMVGVWGNLDTEMYHAEVPTIAAMDEAIENAMAGAGDENVIEIVKVNGTALTPDENKAVNVIVNQIDVGRTNKGAANESDYARFARVMNDGSYSDKLAFFYDKATDEFRALFETQGDFENDLEVQLASRTYVNTAITTELAGVTQIDFVKVSDVASLPATGVKGTFYLVPNTGSGQNVYDEYVWVNKGTTENPDYAYENLGPQVLDLSGYVQESDLNEITTAEIDAMFA